jgi:hypothetical protein
MRREKFLLPASNDKDLGQRPPAEIGPRLSDLQWQKAAPDFSYVVRRAHPTCSWKTDIKDNPFDSGTQERSAKKSGSENTASGGIGFGAGVNSLTGPSGDLYY